MYYRYDIYVVPKSESSVDEVLKVSIDGDAEHTNLSMVEIANHLKKIYSDEFEIVVIKEVRTGSTSREQVNNWDLSRFLNI